MAPYPSPLADCIERAATAMTAPKTQNDPEYAAEWSMMLLDCALMVRALEMPIGKPRRRHLRVDWVVVEAYAASILFCGLFWTAMIAVIF